MRASREQLGLAAAIATAILWGSNHVVARAVRDAVPLPALVFWRWLLGAMLLTVVVRPALAAAWPEIHRQWRQIALGGTIGVGIFSFLLLGGAYHSPALEVGLINATTPVWVALIGGLTGQERLDGRGWSGLLLAFAGTLVIIAKGDLAALLDLRFGFGNLLSLSAALCFAWFSLRVRIWARTIDAGALTAATAWAGILIVMLPAYLWSLAQGTPWLVHPSADPQLSIAAIAYMAVGPTMLGNLFYLFGVGTIGPTKAATFLYLSPVFSALLAITLLGETLRPFHLAGVLVIAAGLWLLTTRSKAAYAP